MQADRGRLELLQFILLHPCTFFGEGGRYRSNCLARRGASFAMRDVVFAHCGRCSSRLARRQVFVAALVQLLQRGIFVGARNVLFAVEPAHSPKPLQCDLLGYRPGRPDAVFCIFVCARADRLAATRAHARAVLAALAVMTPRDSALESVVLCTYARRRQPAVHSGRPVSGDVWNT